MGWKVEQCLIPNMTTCTERGMGSGVVGVLFTDATLFRLLDDEGDVFFIGSISKKDIDYWSEDVAFAPLDWAKGNYGCTEMQYLDEFGDWETL